jgi:hypothetical protein
MDKVNFDNLMFDHDQMNIQIDLFHYQILLYNVHSYQQQLIFHIQAKQHYLVHEMHCFHHHIDLMNDSMLILDEMNHSYNEFQNDLKENNVFGERINFGGHYHYFDGHVLV